METLMNQLWKMAFTVSGLAGIGFFVFWSLYRDWLNLDIFEKMTSKQTFIVMILFLLLIFASLIIAVLAYLKRVPEDNLSDLVMVYQAAYLLHDLTAPTIEAHRESCPDNVLQTKEQIHQAIEADQLKPVRELFSDDGKRGTRWVKLSDVQKISKRLKWIEGRH